MHVSLKFWVDVAWKLKQRYNEGTPTKGLARRHTFRVMTRTRGYVLESTQDMALYTCKTSSRFFRVLTRTHVFQGLIKFPEILDPETEEFDEQLTDSDDAFALVQVAFAILAQIVSVFGFSHQPPTRTHYVFIGPPVFATVAAIIPL